MKPFENTETAYQGRAILFGSVVAMVFALVSCGTLQVAKAAPAAWGSPLSEPALKIDNPQNVALLGLSQAGARWVAVGEHGVIVYSDDKGAHWYQAASPVSVTLTSVHFVTTTEGFATGHFGVVLKTNDAGKSWVIVLNGITAANLALDEAQKMDAASAPDSNAATALAEARRLVKAGPDKPFFDSYFSDAKTGFVVGAYNLIYRTTDGGASWTAWMGHTDNQMRLHLYAIAAVPGAIYIAGEQGLVLRSTDAGQSFQAATLPYGGSFFSVAAGPKDDVVVAGMEGNAFRLDPKSNLWEQIPGLPPVSIVAAAFGTDNKLWLANQTGQVFSSLDEGRSIAVLPEQAGPPPPPFTTIMPAGENILAGTVAGIERIPLSNASLTPRGASDGS